MRTKKEEYIVKTEKREFTIRVSTKNLSKTKRLLQQLYEDEKIISITKK